MNKTDLQEIGSLIEEKLEPVKKTLNEHSDKLDALVLDVIHIHKKTDVLPDLHSLIKDTREKVVELDDRVERLETAA